MAHRVRSRTADSAESKKTKGTPRRLTEKIAIMKRREHEQSAAFKKAMKSILEMQQAQQARTGSNIHSGGGSMPSLAAIDSTPLPPSIDMQSVFNDLNEVTMRSSTSTTCRERPHSGGPTGRRSQFDKRTQSCDTDPYPTSIGMGHVEQHYLNQPDWMEGDLSRHKSDSDLQQSLLTQQQQLGGAMLPPHQQQFPPLVHPRIPPTHTSPPIHHNHQNHKLQTPNDLGVWGKPKRPASISTAASLLSPDTGPHTYQNTLTAPGTGTASSSLPDLTNIDFQSGLDIPLERDDLNPPLQMLSYQSPPSQLMGNFLTSNLLLNSFQADSFPRPQNNLPYITNHAYVYQPLLPNVPNVARSVHPAMSIPNRIVPSSCPFNTSQLPHPLSTNIPALNLNPNANWRPSQFNNVASFSSGASAIRKSPTAPNFQNFIATSGTSGGVGASMSPSQSRAAAYQQFHPLLPSLLHPVTSRVGPSYSGIHLSGQNIAPQPPFQPAATVPPPQMNIVIQPPSNSLTDSSPSSTQPAPTPFSPSSHTAQSPLTPQTPSFVQSPPSSATMSTLGASPSVPIPFGGSENHPRGPYTIPGVNSLPGTPTITISPGGVSALPSYIVAKQQEALQEKFASFGMHKTEHLIRSHSEENLQQKGQKEKSDLMHNPFMGNLANANSVPCVYVDSPSNENIAEHCDSPTGDSPSTSASYASSPPSVRPFWIDQHQPNEFVFHGHEWPIMDGGGTGVGGGANAAMIDKTKPGSPSPISHHKSLSDLNAPVEYAELSPRSSRALQLSLPSIVMSDLAMDEQAERPGSPVGFNYASAVEDAVMDTLLKEEEIPGLQSFDMGLLTADVLMSSSPDSILQRSLQF